MNHPGRRLLELLWEVYALRVPYANVFVKLAGADFRNDHIAFRSLRRPGSGVDQYARVFERLGWTRAGDYAFSDAHLHAIHLSGTRKMNNAEGGAMRRQQQMRINPPIAQPVVRVHPETGRKALYLGEKVRRFDGMTEEESKPLIDYLNRHATRPEFVYRHRWRADDILAWDNRCTMHQALGDFDETQRRHMERTTVRGTPSGYVVAEA